MVLGDCRRLAARGQLRRCRRCSLRRELRHGCRDAISLQHAFEQIPLLRLDEAVVQPAEDVIGDRLCEADLAITAPAAGLETRVRKLLAEDLQRNAVLQSERDLGCEGVHQSRNGRAFVRHLDEDLARLSVGIETNGNVAFMSRDRELMCERCTLFG